MDVEEGRLEEELVDKPGTTIGTNFCVALYPTVFIGSTGHRVLVLKTHTITQTNCNRDENVKKSSELFPFRSKRE